MGICSSKKQKIDKLNKIYSLFNKESIFHVDEDGLTYLAKKMKNKEIDILNKKILKLSSYLKNLKNMDTDQYINDKLLDKDKKINKEEFIKVLKMFNNEEIDIILRETKKLIFLNLRKQFE